MQFLLEKIYRCNAAANITFTTVMATKGVNVVPTIRALLYADDPLLSCLIHEVILDKLMYLSFFILEVGAD